MRERAVSRLQIVPIQLALRPRSATCVVVALHWLRNVSQGELRFQDDSHETCGLQTIVTEVFNRPSRQNRPRWYVLGSPFDDRMH